jgi:nucleolar protein 58
MLVLFETAAGYAVFKMLNESKLSETENLYKEFETPEKASKLLQLQHFHKFDDTTIALAAITGSVEGKIPKSLKKLLKKISADAEETMLVADAKLGSSIKEKFSINCVHNTNVQDLMRLIRGQMESLIKVPEKEIAAMRIGLAHSLSRYKLKFSPDKVDTMIVQAISLLDDLDKELNNYIMRCKEWYGWHFPEMSKIILDNIAYCKTIKKMGYKTNAATVELNDILPEDVEEKVKEAAEVSMGTEISEEDLSNITNLCDQVLEISEYRNQLYEYLKNRMMAVAPNLTALVGELVGARLIAHAGSLLNLAKHPSSTVQILGAEKALFRAMKTKHDTPKYGLIYHASLVGQSGAKYKGKVSRMLAAKCALAIRVDALGEDVNNEMGIEHRASLEKRMQALESGITKKISGSGKQKAKFDKYSVKREAPREEAAEAMQDDESTIPTFKKRKY